MAGPTILLCVGAQKAGTTWLYRHLQAHPDCHLRAIKELHYFNTVEKGTYARQIKEQTALARDYAERLAEAPPDRAPQVARNHRDVTDWIAVLERRREDIPAYLAYLTDARGVRRLVADITPYYALLSEGRLRDMAAIADDVRVLYLMRDPVDRLWSQVRMQARMRARRALTDPNTVPASALYLMKDQLACEVLPERHRSDYLGAITRLRAAVDPSRLMIMFQDEMLSVPGLARLSAFLGIAPRHADFAKKVHEGEAIPLPEDMRVRAARLLRPQYEFVARQFPALPDSWQRNMEVWA